MEGLCGLRTLLLWAAVISLSYGQNISDTNDSSRSPVDPPENVPLATNDVNATNTSKPIQCSYTVTPIKYGFRFNISSSATGMYDIVLIKDGLPVTRNSNATLVNITHLKPCTEYEHSVKYHSADNEKEQQGARCNFMNPIPKGFTKDINQNEVTYYTSNGCLWLTSEWNISTSLSLPKNYHVEVSGNDMCIKPAYSDICSEFKTHLTFARNCTSIPLMTLFSADIFLTPENIKQTFTFTLPSNITAHLPPKCTSLSIAYSCEDMDVGNVTVNVAHLEPFTNYTCTGHIMKYNVTQAKLPPFLVRIDCDLQILIRKRDVTQNSIVLGWTTESKNCSSVVSELKELAYECSCVPRGEKNNNPGKSMPSQRSNPIGCTVTGLNPYTIYTCTVQPTYRSQHVGQAKTTYPLRTAIGVPDDVTDLEVTVENNNAIKVICKHSNQFNGPFSRFNAILRRGSGNIEESKQTKENCEFLFTDMSYSTTYHVEVFASNVDFNSSISQDTVTTHYNDKALTGFLIFLIIFTSVALLVVLYKIYVVKRQRDMSENLLLIPNAKSLSVEPIEADTLLEAYKRKLADEGRLFLDEFQSIPRIFTRHSMKEAKKPCNTPKNRYVDILPYDYNRVQLSTGNGEAGCDYINASFIDGYNESKKYIAAQGPKEETVCDFWRMIWEQQSSIIVMVTRCEEGNKVKCVQYWPSADRETEIYEEFVVQLTSEDHFPDYTIRNLSLTNRREKSTEREVTHIQFISWPDHGVPGEPHLLLKLRRRVNAFKNIFSGPIVVHCSAGVGRTGTYIGIDAMMECLEAESRVDIYGYVFKLRKQRCLMVQVEAQYILIHQALLEHNQFGETEISLSELHSALSMLKDTSTGNEPTLLEEEFERLPTYKNWKTFNTGITEENKAKNRCSSIVPYDYNRVLLRLGEGSSGDSIPDEDQEEESSDEEEDSTKYINASNIHGYSGPCTFIAAQTPLESTVADFWLMVYQKKASTIIMLEAHEEEKESVYWGRRGTNTYGDIEVEVESEDDAVNVIHRIMLIRHVKRKENRRVRHVQFLKWGNRELPEKPQDLTDMIKDVKRRPDSSKPQGGAPVVVHCSDGSSRCGVFCALWSLLDSAETEMMVDVFQVTRSLRKERQGMIASLDQYKFLYDALDGVYPVQNGEVKAVQAPEVDSVLLVNETQPAVQQPGEKAEDTTGPTEMGQQGAADSSTPVAETRKEDEKEAEQVSSIPTETTPLEDNVSLEA
ncbi:receptor-type tyrosine-protein phosphatase C isoform X2 [Dunckerocampus dactyliophorus]|uniref:receptor-type tyrosine-protein phosphatase C isoform X2 n=1 Tax=Dunckerocampus dactyliophorus TaxID=161453 RepID=UPI0024065EC6|nr:receptor-type tyrosine-protein phosphatase C isoform X2 [Dunckerocampus dactyliophorus]